MSDDDIVADLRALATIVDEAADANVTVTLVDGSLLVEAADEIERLRARVAELSTLGNAWHEAARAYEHRLMSEGDRLVDEAIGLSVLSLSQMLRKEARRG